MKLRIQFNKQMDEEYLRKMNTKLTDDNIMGAVSFSVWTSIWNKSSIILETGKMMGTLFDYIVMLNKLECWIQKNLEPTSITVIS